jgi:F-type H+-transporting ATPase subunit b
MDQFSNLGINGWSMLLYLGNTGLLLAVLTYFLYKPILRFIDQRRKQISDNIQQAENLQKAFEEKLAQSEKEREAADAKFKAELSELKTFTEKKRSEMISEMEEKRAEMIRKAQEEIDQRKNSLLKEAENQVKELMVKIILEIVEKQVPENVVQDSISSAWKKYNK